MFHKLSLLTLVIFAIGSLNPMLAQDTGGPSFLLLSRTEAQSIKYAIVRKDPAVQRAAESIRRDAERSMTDAPWSVTFHRPPIVGLDPHEYYSEDSYWWPNPADPNGPYVDRDGETNPNLFTANNRNMEIMTETVLSLGMAAYFFDDARFADHADKILRVWFIAQNTRMNPDLEHAQAIHGITAGQGIGIIDTWCFIRMIQGISFLEHTGQWSDADRAALRQWFADYLFWMTHSYNGLHEKREANNHATWWTAQVATYAAYLSDETTEDMAWNLYREDLVPNQIRPGGALPLEEKRTKSLSYVTFNLNAFSIICRLAQMQGTNLWHFRASDGASVARAVAYYAPFVVRPQTWPKRQIAPFQSGQAYFLAFAGAGINSPEYITQYNSLQEVGGPWSILVHLLSVVK